MTSSLNLSLPEAPRTRGRFSLLQVLTFLLALATLASLLLGKSAYAPAPGGDSAAQKVEVERLKSLATDLEKRTLYAEAEKAWGEYAASASLSPEKRRTSPIVAASA